MLCHKNKGVGFSGCKPQIEIGDNFGEEQMCSGGIHQIERWTDEMNSL